MAEVENEKERRRNDDVKRMREEVKKKIINKMGRVGCWIE